MIYEKFPDKGTKTLLAYTNALLTEHDGREFAKRLMNGASNMKNLVNSTSLASVAGHSGYLDAIRYFRDGVLTDDMSEVISQLRCGKIHKSKQVQVSDLGKRVYGSFLGFVMGDALGLSLYDADVTNTQYHSMAIVETLEHYGHAQTSYNTEMMISQLLLNASGGTNGYLLDRSLDNYIRILKSGTSNAVQPHISHHLVKDSDPVNGDISKYKYRFNRLFKVKYDDFFNVALQQRNLYGGCFARIIPLALTMKIEPEVMDVWITDPYISAFTSVHYIVTLLRLFYDGASVSKVLSKEFNLSGTYLDLDKAHRKHNKCFEYDTDDVYVKAAHYAMLSILYSPNDVLFHCVKTEDSTNYHIFFPIILAIYGARVGSLTFLSDPIMRYNITKIREYKFGEGNNTGPEEFFINSRAWHTYI